MDEWNLALDTCNLTPTVFGIPRPLANIGEPSEFEHRPATAQLGTAETKSSV